MEFKIEEKYQSMARSLQRLKKINTNNGTSISNTDAKDATEDFFSQAYHFKDWLRKDPRIGANVESFINASKVLTLAADYCNSFKHAGLDSAPRSGEEIAKINTHISMDFSEQGVKTSSRLEITLGEEKIDALSTAEECVADWNKFLEENGLGKIMGEDSNPATIQANIGGTARIIKP